MRVCMLAYSFYELDNRVKRYAESLVERGEQVDVLALRRNGQPTKDRIKGVRVLRIQPRKMNEHSKISYLVKILFFFINSTIRLTLLDIKKRYDVVHVHSVPDFEVFAAAFVKMRGAKIILDIHDLVPEFYASKFNAGHQTTLFKMLKLIEKLSIAFADHVIIANHIWYNTLITRSVKEQKCSVFLNYPDPKIFYLREQKRENRKFVLLYPGTLNAHQGLDIAIKAIALVKEKIHNIEFQIYGIGDTKNFLQSLVGDLCLRDTVIFNDVVPMEEIAEIMSKADLGLIPKRASSFGNEAFSTKIFEFMSLGIPVIVSDTKIDKYYFSDCEVKFFPSGNEKELANCIIDLYKNQNKRAELRENALRFISEYSWDKNKYTYYQLLDTLCDKDK